MFMKPFLLFAILLLAVVNLFSQHLVSPGGVHGAGYWLVSNDPDSLRPFSNKGQDSLNLYRYSNLFRRTTLNFHVANIFDRASEIEIPFAQDFSTQSTFFTVYKSLDTTVEGAIWHISENKRAKIVSTTDRLADLGEYNYMNYVDIIRSNPKVNVYVQSKMNEGNIASKASWLVGKKPKFPGLPISSFNGIIPEIVAYDRALGSQESINFSY
jgi:hypothetical protein